jgi:hypothetical protein
MVYEAARVSLEIGYSSVVLGNHLKGACKKRVLFK